jgi:curved DNA-binding protein CbpA
LIGGHLVGTSDFIDFYEILEISPNANSDTIDRVFRYLAQRYHPDNPDSGDRARFDVVMEAHDTLKDGGKRAQYDVQHKSYSGVRWKLANEANYSKGMDRDAEMQSRLLSILYVKRRRNVSDPGIGNFELERLLSCPAEHLEFHIWYLREKGWIQRTESGTLAITVAGVDRANSEHNREPRRKLLSDERHAI